MPGPSECAPDKRLLNERRLIRGDRHGRSIHLIEGTAIKGEALQLTIAAGHVPNFVDLATGGYGAAIQDALNSSQTPTMANFATLGSLLAGCITLVTADACTELFAVAALPTGAVPADTLAVAEAIARNPAHQADKVFALLDAFYPVPKGKKLRATPFMPYLTFAPSAWVLPLKLTGGGKRMFDSQGNAWHANRFGSSELGRLKLYEMGAAYAIAKPVKTPLIGPPAAVIGKRCFRCRTLLRASKVPRASAIRY